MDDSALDSDFTQCFDLAKLMFFYVPINPYRRFLGNISRREYFSGVCVFCFVLLSILVLILFYALFINDWLTNDNGDFLTSVSASVGLVLAIAAFLFTICIFWFGQDVADLIAILYESFPKSREESALIDAEIWTRDWANKMLLQRNVFAAALFGMVVSPIAYSLANFALTSQWENELPLLLWLPFDPLVMPIIYPLVYAVEIWFLCINTCIIVALEATVGAVAILICLEFKKVILQFSSFTFGDYKADLKALLIAMQLHTRTLDLAERARKTFSIFLFITYVSSSMVVCIFTFLIFNATDVLMKCKYSANLSCFLFYVAMFGYYGDLMIDYSTAVAEAIYASNWMDADVRIQRMIIMIIQRANSPQILSGLDFFDASFPSMAKILTTSYSYFTLLKSSYKN